MLVRLLLVSGKTINFRNFKFRFTYLSRFIPINEENATVRCKQQCVAIDFFRFRKNVIDFTMQSLVLIELFIAKNKV